MPEVQGMATPSDSRAARFFRPPLPAGHIYRPRLTEALRQGLSGRLSLVCAPAGFGKSQLASELCEQLPSGWQVLWLGLSARDKEPGRFLEQLLEALRTLYPDLAGGALERLRLRQRHQPFPFEQWLDEVLEALELVLDESKPLLLIIDDYHLATGPVLDRCLQFLINHVPPSLSLMVTTRQAPNWHLARLRLAGHLLELNELDLRLLPAEVEQWLTKRGVAASPELVETLLLRSEGWLAGLQMLWMAGDGGQELELTHLQGRAPLISEYLLQEVVERLPADVQSFLYDTALLDRFSPALCDAVRLSHDSAAMIDYLFRHQLFLVPLDERGQWYRYHHLFGDLLRARQQELALTNPAQIYLRACQWFVQQGEAEDAVEHALLAERPDVVASLVQNLSEEQLLSEQNVVQLLRWKRILPDSLLHSSPRLIILYSWALLLACQLQAAEDLLAHLQRFLPAPSESQQRVLLAQWQALQAMLAKARGQVVEARELGEQALAGMPDELFGPQLMLLTALASVEIGQGNIEQARHYNRRGLELARRSGNPAFEALMHYERARVLLARGLVKRALDEVQQGLALVPTRQARKLSPVRGRLHLYRGFVSLFAADFDFARQELLLGLEEARACRDVAVLTAYFGLAMLDARKHSLAAGYAWLEEAERLMSQWDVPQIYYLGMMTVQKCMIWLQQGRLQTAQSWLQSLAEAYCQAPRAAPPELHPQIALQVEILLLRTDAVERNWPGVEAREQALNAALASSHQGLMHQFAHMQLAYVAMARGQHEAANEQMSKLLHLAGGGVRLHLFDMLQRYPQLLHSQLHKASSAVQAWLSPQLGDDPLPVSTELLSDREFDVLQLVAQGLSNQQISEKLFISLHTVKTHVRNIHGKLGVQRRTQAVARAKALGLLG
ncbi:LuxR C-terminal-related transcriptional regulator [Atopomonas sediminilitoris]|uniref:LuxR C-terminal-related transcriptional regulator n=1 Tax=Atopomonas sediminilitoris TaxID=2919919 RepID=UPI001F4D97CB|nr:LuxR C-terminal-related transcriptional regulator [Atopomonas sediminilitoris]MCJ8169756.1 LuxR C-terminal-related transcriptional regulator [Atopomonas sediminilitoris]